MAKSSDEIKELQRSINRLLRADGTLLRVGGRAYLVRLEAVVDPDALLALLARETVSEAEALDGLARSCRLRDPARWIDGRGLGSLQRDLKILEKHPDLANLTRQAPRLFRGQTIDRGWLAGRRAQLARLQEALARWEGGGGALPWWEATLALARTLQGDAAAEELERIRERSTRVSAERRREALRRIEGLARRLEGQPPSRESRELAGFLDEAAQRALQVQRLPGRARRKRLRQIVAAVLAWPGEPAPLIRLEAPQPEPDMALPLPQLVRELAARRIAQQPSTRSPEHQERLALCLSRYGLLFPPLLPADPDGALELDEALLERALRRWEVVRERLAGFPLRLDQVLALLELPEAGAPPRWSDLEADLVYAQQLGATGRWVAGGLELPLLREAARLRILGELVWQDWDVETVRAYCRWVARLAPHYRRQGVQLALTPRAFPRLRAAKREELAVLGLCLLEHHGPSAAGPSDRRIAMLDATLALFQKLPDRARACLAGLDRAPAGLGAELCPELAAWLEHDPGLDRYLHLRGLLGAPQAPSKSLLRDFELAVSRSAELAYLASLADPGEAQRRRIAQLSRSLPPPGPGWTKRRLAERTEALAAQVLERRLDQALAEILRHAYGLSLPRITPAWRDVFRFFLAVDKNQDLLGLLLRHAAALPGRYFPPSLPRNRQWLESAAARMRVEAWLLPRRRPVEIAGRRYTLEVEEDPVLVLRMGIPFGTCLSLTDGCNAAATVINALDVNKRVLYLKDAGGTPVARQLIAVSGDFALLRYRLYSALAPEHEARTAREFRALCEEIARETGLPLGDGGEPDNLHEGVWYDDGVEPFAEPGHGSLVEQYCRSLGLPVPPVVSNMLREDAELWGAVQAKDAARFERAALAWSDSLAHNELGERLVEELGPAKIARLFRAGAQGLLRPLLRHRAAQEAEALLRASRGLVRTSEDAEVLRDLLAALPLGPDALKAMGTQVARLAAGSTSLEPYGFEARTLSELPRAAGRLTMSQLLDLCDRLEPVWGRLVAPECEHPKLRDAAERHLLAAAEGAFLRDPDTRLVVSCLRTRRRSRLAQRVALHILSLFPFPRQSGQSLDISALSAFDRAPSDAPWARRALQELAARRPELGRSPEMLAALLRQGAGAGPAAEPLPDLPDEPPYLCALAVIWRERRALATAQAASHPDLAGALEALLAAEAADHLWIAWLCEIREATRGALGPLLVDVVGRWLVNGRNRLFAHLTPDLILWLWGFEALREPLLGVLGRLDAVPALSETAEVRRLYLALGEAARARSLDPRELFERWTAVLLEGDYLNVLTSSGDRDFLRLAMRAALSRARPQQWLDLYESLPDVLSVSLFLRELARQPERKLEELGGLLRPLEDAADWRRMLRFWLERALASAPRDRAAPLLSRATKP